MKKVAVKVPFTLHRDNGEVVKYGLGIIDMPDVDADHFWTRIHTANEPTIAAIDAAQEKKQKQKAD
jgi:hypothetical protein